ncbi:MAG: C40 family peptidase [Candidatus Magasanikbacteria bacterium]|nr:C40 family peptidase [Candidatus Magasanikbacteria bacterium]
MISKTLSQPALDMIQKYLNLPFADKNVSCPYFNNRRSQVRGALRVLIGKGTPQDIADEAIIFSMKEKIDLEQLSDEELKKYLVDHNLGSDCSGFVYHVLNAELETTHKKSLRHILHFPHAKNIIRKLLIKLRPVENCGVSTLAHEKNSSKIELQNIQPGDLIIILNAGPQQDYNHVMIIKKIEYEHTLPKIIHYTHSFQYPRDGKYGHGIKQEKIEIIDVQKNLLEQNWNEGQMREYGKNAQSIKIQRLK